MSRKSTLVKASIGGLVLLLVCCSITFYIGKRTASTKAELQNDRVTEIWMPVENEELAITEEWQGEYKKEQSQSLKVQADEEPQVLLFTPLKKGDAVIAGELLGVVSGRPLIGLCGEMALYRDLALNDSGYDVRSLQRSLNESGIPTHVDGKLGLKTFNAVVSLYKNAGFEDQLKRPKKKDFGELKDDEVTHQQNIIPFRNFVKLPTCNSTATSVVPVGTKLETGDKIMEVATSESLIRFVVDSVAAETMTVGENLETSINGETSSSRIIVIGSPRVDEENGSLGIEVSLPAPKGGVEPGSSIRISREVDLGTDVDDYVVFPATALRVDTEGDFVFARDSGTKSEPERIPVKILGEANGRVAVTGEFTGNSEVQVG